VPLTEEGTCEAGGTGAAPPETAPPDVGFGATGAEGRGFPAATGDRSAAGDAAEARVEPLVVAARVSIVAGVCTGVCAAAPAVSTGAGAEATAGVCRNAMYAPNPAAAMQSATATPNPMSLFIVISRTLREDTASTVPKGFSGSTSKRTSRSAVYQNGEGGSELRMTPRVYTFVLICKRCPGGSEWHGMRLLSQLEEDGDRLFRWRSYLPLVFVPVVIAGVMTSAPPFSTKAGERLWESASVMIALAGLALRVWAVGSAPSGTSERSTVNPRASQLRTTGPYSLIRHPLYAANGLMAFGLSLFPGIWYLPVILALATLLYYERIAIREEAFLADRFGAEFDAWSARVRACRPSLATYQRSAIPYSWRKVLRHEFHGLLVVAAGAFVFDAMQERARAGVWRVDGPWAWFFAASAALFLVFAALKRGTRLFEE
jgi:protein-S-isoprenylcysteine O-methyltransferase Ste14